MANISAIELKTGYIIDYKNGKWRVVSTEHVKPGKGGAFMQVELKNIKTGTKSNERFRSEDKIDRLMSDTIDAQFSYASDDSFYFLNLESYEEIAIDADVVKNHEFLTDNLKVKLDVVDDEIVGVTLPESVVLEVVETEPQIKGSTATNANKRAKMSNGIEIMVPSFISEGEKLVVRVVDSQYMERYKNEN